MINQINIRPYITDDYPRVREILEQGGLYYEGFDSSERIGEKIARDPNSVFVSTDSDQVVGTVSVMENGIHFSFSSYSIIQRTKDWNKFNATS